MVFPASSADVATLTVVHVESEHVYVAKLIVKIFRFAFDILVQSPPFLVNEDPIVGLVFLLRADNRLLLVRREF